MVNVVLLPVYFHPPPPKKYNNNKAPQKTSQLSLPRHSVASLGIQVGQGIYKLLEMLRKVVIVFRRKLMNV